MSGDGRSIGEAGGARTAGGRAPGGGGARSLAGKILGFVVSLALLGAAVWAVWSNRAQFENAFEHTRRQPWLLVALVAVLPLLNWLLVSMSFWVLMRRRGYLGRWEMCALVGNAWLLNYLPLRPGMVSRVAWHKVVNGIGVRHSAAAIVILAGMSGAGALLLLGIAITIGPGARAGTWALWLGTPLLLGMAYAIVSGSGTYARALGVCFVLRFADMLVWSGRYSVAFELVGSPLDLPGAIALAGVSQVAMFVPISGNGLGLREWLIGLTGSVLPAALVTTRPDETAGLAADLVNRSAEVLVAVPLGLVSGVWLARAFRRWRRGRAPGTGRVRGLRNLSGRWKAGRK